MLTESPVGQLVTELRFEPMTASFPPYIPDFTTTTSLFRSLFFELLQVK